MINLHEIEQSHASLMVLESFINAGVSYTLRSRTTISWKIMNS